MQRSIGSTCAVDDRPSGRPMREARRDAEAEREIDQRAERQPAQHHLHQAEPENVLAQPPQPARVELEPDQEQQEGDADFRHRA